MSPIYIHIEPRKSLLPHLLPLLPASLPLVRRIQFQLQTPDALVLSTLPVSSSYQYNAIHVSAYLDRSRSPETECWIFSSIELVCNSKMKASNPGDSAELALDSTDSAVKTNLLALLAFIATLSPTASPLLLVGAMHSHLLGLLREEPYQHTILRQQDPHGERWFDGDERKGCISGFSETWAKFLIPPRGADTTTQQLPKNLVWSKVQEEDCKHILASTTIPRTASTLMELPSAAIRKGEELVAWAFLGVDGSLTSLHVDEKWRGQGLGKQVARMTFNRLLDTKGFADIQEGKDWCHSDTEWSNLGSIGVVRGFGGVFGWNCHWVKVDLRRVGGLDSC